MSQDRVSVVRNRDRVKSVYSGGANEILAFTSFIATVESRGFILELPEKEGDKITIIIGLGVNAHIITLTLAEIDRGYDTTLNYEVEAYRSGDRDYRDKR